MTKTLSIFFLISFAGVTANCAEYLIPAFRHPSISETEFQARAISLGVLPAATFLANRTLRLEDMQTTLREKTVLAQIEWIEAKNAKHQASSGAIEALLDLENKEDWSEDDRKIFTEFLIRKTSLRQRNLDGTLVGTDPWLNRLAQHIKRHSLSFDPKTEQIDVVISAKKIADRLLANRYTFADLPDDVVGVLVNGTWHSRSSKGFELFFPHEQDAESAIQISNRLTFVSNLFQPVTLLISTHRNFENLGQRQPWISTTSPCTVDLSKYGSANGQIQPVVVGEKTCEAMIGLRSVKSEAPSLKQISGFGRGEIPLDPFRSTAPIPQPPSVRPWLWAAIGSVATIAIVLSARTKETQVQPTSNSGW